MQANYYMQKPSLIFICTGNSARSQLAEALFKQMAGAEFDVYSAGTAPELVDPRVFEVLQSRHIPSAGLHSKALSSLSDRHFDYAITLCDKAHQSCVTQVKAAQILAWDFADPKPKAGSKAFDVVLNELSERIKYFLLFSRKYRDSNEQLSDALSFYKALADDTRLKALLLIQQQQELCVCELTTALSETQPKNFTPFGPVAQSGHFAGSPPWPVGILPAGRQPASLGYRRIAADCP